MGMRSSCTYSQEGSEAGLAGCLFDNYLALWNKIGLRYQGHGLELGLRHTLCLASASKAECTYAKIMEIAISILAHMCSRSNVLLSANFHH